jgi:hypothetical protein
MTPDTAIDSMLNSTTPVLQEFDLAIAARMGMAWLFRRTVWWYRRGSATVTAAAQHMGVARYDGK